MTEHEEIWVEVGIGYYEVSNFGRVVNGKTGRDLKPSADGKGYMRVALYYKGVRHDVFVHRLVARAFFLNYGPGVEVRHINGDKKENTVLNLTLGGACRVGDGSI